jgi:arylsulfatase A
MLKHRHLRSWRTAVVAGCATLFLAGAGVDSSPGAAPSPRLNVVFMLADDLGYGELGCYGQEKIPTPHLDRLALEGMRFTHHYSGAPTCAPSRGVLLTGRHLGRAEIRANRQASRSFPQFTEGQHPISANALTVARVFQQAGYATGAFGKWGLGPVGSTGDPNRHGFDLFYGYNCQAVAHSFYPPHLWRNSERVTLNARPIPGHQVQPEGEVRIEDWIGENYAPEQMLQAAIRFIREHRERPFFLYLPFIEPHVAMHPPRSSVDQFPEDWDTEPYRGQCGYLPHPRPRAGYAAMISDLDRHVGRIRATLEETGVADRTLVIFTSDNGTTLPRRADTHFHVGGVDPGFFRSTAGLRGFKGSLYEGGIRVPLLVHLPGRIRPGAVSDFPSYFADWFPTLCEAAGLPRPSGLDGESLWPMLTGATSPGRRKPLVWAYAEYGGQVAIRFQQHKVIRQGLLTKRPGPWEVYDLKVDPAETHDLAATRSDLIRRAEEVLRQEVSDNPVFPLELPRTP